MLRVLSLIHIFSLGLSTGYAQPEESATVTVTGTGSGLEVSPSPAALFDLNNMNPGDYVQKTLVIKNNYSRPFTLYLTDVYKRQGFS